MLIALLAWYGLTSLATLALYARDKAAARDKRPRVSERTLHLCALLGGWPGALAAQHWLRHKSAKQAFLAVFRLTVVANCLVMVWLVSRLA